jgi:hypothetical protein
LRVELTTENDEKLHVLNSRIGLGFVPSSAGRNRYVRGVRTLRHVFAAVKSEGSLVISDGSSKVYPALIKYLGYYRTAEFGL